MNKVKYSGFTPAELNEFNTRIQKTAKKVFEIMSEHKKNNGLSFSEIVALYPEQNENTNSDIWFALGKLSQENAIFVERYCPVAPPERYFTKEQRSKDEWGLR
jgi:hypothetical protein